MIIPVQVDGPASGHVGATKMGNYSVPNKRPLEPLSQFIGANAAIEVDCTSKACSGGSYVGCPSTQAFIYLVHTCFPVGKQAC